MTSEYDEIQGEIEDVEFGNMSIDDCIYYEEVLDELSFYEFDKDGYVINEFNPKYKYNNQYQGYKKPSYSRSRKKDGWHTNYEKVQRKIKNNRTNTSLDNLYSYDNEKLKKNKRRMKKKHNIDIIDSIAYICLFILLLFISWALYTMLT